MSNKVQLTGFFLRKAKRLLKKYQTLQSSLKNLELDLLQNPKLGDSYGANIYKVRLADDSKGKGKIGGFRVITYLIEESKESTNIYLITIFDKSEHYCPVKISFSKNSRFCANGLMFFLLVQT